jgi:drug/metabolite transporter (DMT)-like permease
MAMVFIANSQAADSDAVRYTGILLGHSLCGILGIIGLFIYPFHPTGAEIGYIFLLGIAQIAIPYILLAIASKHCPALASNLISMLEPLLNPVWVMLFYGETPGTFALLGSAVIIGAVVIWTIADARAETSLSD